MNPGTAPGTSETAFTVELMPWGCRLVFNGIALEASGIVWAPRAVIRALVSVRRDETLLYRDQVNLTSGKGRSGFVKTLQEKTAVEIPEKALLAFDEAIRRRPKPKAEDRSAGGSSDFSGTYPSSLVELEGKIGEHLLLEDPDILPVLLGAVKAHRLQGDSVWLLIVGPPSGAKTELLRILSRVPRMFPLSELTARTFASGLTSGGDDPSLLMRLKDEILVLKDFTTVLEMYREERQAILAQLREIYDGGYDKVWGTGKELHWRGRLGFIAGVTPVIDSHHSVIAILGQRFVLFRWRQPNRQAVGRRAMRNRRNSKKEQKIREELATAVARFMASLSDTDPEVSEAHEDTISTLADFVTRARSGVERDGYRRELNYAPEPEMPGRLARQLFSLARGLALVSGRLEVADEDIRRVIRVGFDCMPAVRRLVLEALTREDGDPTTTTLARHVQYSTTTIRRALEDLQALELVDCEKGGAGVADKWSLREQWRQVMTTFSEMSEQASASAGKREAEPFEEGVV